GLHGDTAPARGRRGLLRRGRAGGQRRRELDPRAERLDGGGPVRGCTLTDVAVAPAGVEVRAPGDEEILSPDALAFVALLQRELGPRRAELLRRRHERSGRPDFLDET